MRRLAWLVSVLCVLLPKLATAQPLPTPAVTTPMPTADSTPPTQLRQGQALSDELLHVDAELARLRAQRPGIFLPIAVTAVGLGIAMLNSAIAIAAFTNSKRQDYRWDEDGNRYRASYREESGRADAREASAFVAAGAAVTALGMWLLIPRVRTRRALRAQARPLRERQLQLRRELQLDFGAARTHASLTATYYF